MATEPQKTNLLNLLSENFTGNTSAIESLQESLSEVEPIIEYFTPSCEGFDTRIVALASSINNIKSEIVVLHSNANAVGCGTTAGQSTIRQDIVRNLSYEVSNENYVGDSPFDIISTTLSSGNVGYGTFLTYTQDDPTAGIGTEYADLGTCYGSPCISGTCVSFASSIAVKESEITTLRTELNSLISPVNSIKTERINYHVRRYADKIGIIELTAENVRIAIAITTLNNPTFDPFT